MTCRAANPDKAAPVRMHALQESWQRYVLNRLTAPLPLPGTAASCRVFFLLVKRGHTQLLMNRVGLLFAHANAFAKIVQIDSFFTRIQVDTE